MLRSTWHAGLRGAVQRADAAAVDERVHLHRDARRPALLVRRDGLGDLRDDPVAQEVRARRAPCGAPGPAEAGEEVEHVGDVGAEVLVAGEEAEVGVQPRGVGVVVAGADVDVVAHAVALAAHDEQALGVRLQRRVPVDDVDAGLLQRARPADVRALVEAGLELHEADRLLAALGRADERGHERRVVRRAVDGHLDRQDVGVLGRLLDEALDRAREGVVGVVDEDVAVAHRREDVGRAALLALQPRLRDRRPGRIAQVAEARQLDDLPQVVEVEQALDVVGLVLVDLERLDQPRAQLRAPCPPRAPRARPRRSAGGAAPARPRRAGRRPRRRPRGRRRGSPGTSRGRGSPCPGTGGRGAQR